MSRSSIWDQLERRPATEPEVIDEPQDEIAEPPLEPVAYMANEFSFVRPEGLVDKTYHVLSSSASGPSNFSIVFSRAPTGDDDALEVMAQRVLAELEKMPDFAQREPLTPYAIDSVDALRLQYSWRHQGRLLHVDQVLFLHLDELGQKVLLQITATSNHSEGMTGKQMAQIEQVLTSFTLRQAVVDDGPGEAESSGTTA